MTFAEFAIANKALDVERAKLVPKLRVVSAAHLIEASDLDANDPRAVTTIVSAPPPARHHNLFAVSHMPRDVGHSGFLLSDGSFADRLRAAQVAIDAGQIKALAHPPFLYSEDLW